MSVSKQIFCQTVRSGECSDTDYGYYIWSHLVFGIFSISRRLSEISANGFLISLDMVLNVGTF